MGNLSQVFLSEPLVLILESHYKYSMETSLDIPESEASYSD